MASLIATETVAVCSACGLVQRAKADKAGGVKLPLRWKRHSSGQLFCSACWRERYVLRAITFPVASPVSGSWKELDAALRKMWTMTTAASNWMMTQCYVRDIRPVEGKMPPMPRVYLYPEARKLFPDFPPRSLASLEQSIQRTYRAKRFEIVGRSSSSLPTMRYPQPFPIPNQAWNYKINEQNQPFVTCRIGLQTWEFRLKSGHRYRRQIDGLRQMEQRGEMAFYKASDGGTLLKLVGWLTRPTSRSDFEPHLRTGTLIVQTGKDQLLSALDPKGKRIWTQNCDHLLRWITAHRKRLQRLSEDQNAEQTPEPSFKVHRKQLAEKHHRRMKSAIQEIAAHLVNFAERRGYQKIEYRDADRWLREFPYYLLEERIRILLDERGIAFEMEASGDVTGGAQDPFEES